MVDLPIILLSTINFLAFDLKIQEKLVNLIYTFDLFPIATSIFLIGLIGFIESRNFLTLLINTELAMLGINFYLITLSLVFGSYEGQIYSLSFLATTAAETAIGLGLLILLYRSKGYITFRELTTLKG